MPHARSAPLLEATGLEVSYGAIRALRGVGLQVGTGETVAVIGANGACCGPPPAPHAWAA